jgi:hypothetical protein
VIVRGRVLAAAIDCAQFRAGSAHSLRIAAALA